MNTTTRDIIRRCRFTPYRNGPTFSLIVWDCHRTVRNGPQWQLGYRLTMSVPGQSPGVVLFEGEDFGNSPMHGIDSNDTIAAIMSFLTLRPGDTDAEYFANYTPAQLEYCDQHAEALSCEVLNRFGER